MLLASVLSFLIQAGPVETLVEKLSSEDVQIREEAARELIKAGKGAIPVLEKASQSKDSEMARRAGDILTVLRAQENLRLIEEALHNARSLRIEAETETLEDIGPVANDHRGSVSLLLKPGNKALFRAGLLGLNAHVRFAVVSNGSSVKVKSPGSEWKEYSTPKDLNAQLESLVLRTGLIHPVYASAHAVCPFRKSLPVHFLENVFINEMAQPEHGGKGRISGRRVE